MPMRSSLFVTAAGALICMAVSINSSCFCTGKQSRSCYRIGDDGVFLRYYGGYPRGEEVFLKVQGADPGTFRFIEGSREGDCQSGHMYAMDRGHVFYRISPIKDADPLTFLPLRYGYSKDAKCVYFRGQAVEGADAEGFTVIENKYARPYGADRFGVFHMNDRLPKDIDAGSFEILHRPYYKDRMRVYYGKHYTVLDGADPVTFTWHEYREIVNDIYYAHDRKNAYYYENGRVATIHGIDHETFTVLGRHYARDKNRVYYTFMIVEGADPKSFHVPEKLKQHLGRDRNHRFIKGKTVE